jgi:hypothetical protein
MHRQRANRGDSTNPDNFWPSFIFGGDGGDSYSLGQAVNKVIGQAVHLLEV